MKDSWRWWTLLVLAAGIGVVSQCAGGREVSVSVALGVPPKAPDTRPLPPMPTPRPTPRGMPEPGQPGFEEHISVYVVAADHRPDEDPNDGMVFIADVRGRTVLFATGSLPDSLDRKLKMVNRSLDRVRVMAAGDEAGAAALEQLAESVPQSRAVVPAGVRAGTPAGVPFEEVHSFIEVSPEVFASGPVIPGSPTQALLIRAGVGWVAVTGCMGPATDEVVARIVENVGSPVVWVVGGVHSGARSDEASARLTVERLLDLGVRRAAVVPCTPDSVRNALQESLGTALLDIQPGAVAVFKP